MLIIKSLSLRNFFSYGNITSLVDFNTGCTTIIKGENLDNTSFGVTSNGCGKSSIIQALSYALYDKGISDVSKDNMINNINKKDMLVTVDFEKNNKVYHVERGRKIKGKGNYVQILENDKDITPDSISNANELLEKIIGLPHDLFTRIVVFSAINTSFLDLPTKAASGPSQTTMIEHLFGLTTLSDKAEILKEHMRDTQLSIDGEKIHIEHLENEHKRYKEQLESSKRRINEWETKRNNEITTLKNTLSKIDKIDFDNQIIMIEMVDSISTKIKDIDYTTKELESTLDINNKHAQQIKNIEKRIVDWDNESKKNISIAEKELQQLSNIDISEQKNLLEKIQSLKQDIDLCHPAIKELTQAIEKAKKEKISAEKDLSHYSDNKCPTCLQEFKDTKIKIEECKNIINNSTQIIEQSLIDVSELKTLLTNLVEQESSIKNKIIVKNVEQLITIESNKIKLTEKIYELNNTNNPLLESLLELKKTPMLNSEDISNLQESIKQIKEQKLMLLKEKDELKNKIMFNTIQEMMTVKNEKTTLINKLKDKEEEINPYISPLLELENNKIDEINFNKLNEANKKLEHQKFLQKLLTKKDSFVRKLLLDKYLPFLNMRLQKYIDDLGLPHKVEFTNDLEARIVNFNRELGFGNLSHGQKARINIALSFAFRDVLQQLHTPINICLLDEVLDDGLDSVGVQSAATMLKRKAKEDKMNLFIISHRDEIETSFDKVLTVQFCDGFSQIKT